nr:MAG TPA: protein of unknown function (DUF5576) [Caudoviricetes sp.]
MIVITVSDPDLNLSEILLLNFFCCLSRVSRLLLLSVLILAELFL